MHIEKSANREVVSANTKDAEEFEHMAGQLHRKTLTKDAVLNWAGGDYKYTSGKNDKSDPQRKVSGI